jgi:hypothetical protein
MLRKYAAGIAVSLALISCGGRQAQPVEDLSGKDASVFALTSLKGTRDGELLQVRAVYSGDSRTLNVDLRFSVTPPARLTAGTWTGSGGEGSVRERSITFLGGQSGPPSIGGKFDLVDRENRAIYRINIPLQELKQRL